MTRKVDHSLLKKAKSNKNDEFYTQLIDIESELKHYTEHFKGKVVYCNCDDPKVSNFFKYFADNFTKLGLKKLIACCYKKQQYDLFHSGEFERAFSCEYTRIGKSTSEEIVYLTSDGDFRGRESIELLKQSDVVVTNPPFSLFREYFVNNL